MTSDIPDMPIDEEEAPEQVLRYLRIKVRATTIPTFILWLDALDDLLGRQTSSFASSASKPSQGDRAPGGHRGRLYRRAD